MTCINKSVGTLVNSDTISNNIKIESAGSFREDIFLASSKLFLTWLPGRSKL